MNHKRGRVKSRRAGCMMCKPHKHQNAPLATRLRPRQAAKFAAQKRDLADVMTGSVPSGKGGGL